MAHHVTWLHLSDLHARKKSDWNSRRVKDTLVADLNELAKTEKLQPDFLFFTGDAAWGHEDDKEGHIDLQFQAAHEFLEASRRAFKTEIPQRRVYLVPGNHDINRKRVTKSVQQYLATAKLDDLVEQCQAADVDWESYMARLQEYAAFLGGRGYDHLINDKKRLIFADRVQLSEDLCVAIAGFNTAWTCYQSKEKAQLRLCGEFQIETLRPDVESAQLRIALMHHPLNWFMDDEDPKSKRILEKDFHFLLHGHEHQGWVDTKYSGQGEAERVHATIAAAACYDRADRENGYNIVRLDLETGRGEVFLRHFSGGSWVKHTMEEAPDGIWPIKAPKVFSAAKETLASTSGELSAASPSNDDAARHEKRFREAVLARHNYLDLPGISLTRDEAKEYELSVAYVSLSLSDSDGLVARGTTTTNQAVTRRAEDVLATLPPGGRMLVTGPAGCGKTTLLRWIAVQCALSRSDLWDLSRYFNEDVFRTEEVFLTEEVFSTEEKTASSRSKKRSVNVRLRRPVLTPKYAGLAKRLPAIFLKEDDVPLVAITEPLFSKPSDYGVGSFQFSCWSVNLPILIRLRDCPKGKLPALADLHRYLADHLPEPPPGWLANVLEEGRAMILLDGVDEVPPEARADIRRQIGQWLAAYPRCQFIITTRPDAVDPGWLKDKDFQHFSVQSLSGADRGIFIDHWHLAVEDKRRKMGKPTDLDKTAASLKDKLRDNFAVARLATNPLLAASICALHLEGKAELPRNEADLCEKLCEMLMDGRDQAQTDLRDLLPFWQAYRQLQYRPHKKPLLAALACAMLERSGSSSLSTGEMDDIIAETLSKFQNLADLPVEQIRSGLIERSGLLRIGTEDRVEFLHNTFKEYLAAGRYKELGSSSIKQLAPHAPDPSWQPVIRFFTALCDPASGLADELVEKILELFPQRKGNAKGLAARSRRAAHLLLVQCRAGAALSPVLQKQIDALRAEFLPPTTLTDAEAIAGCGESALPYLRRRSSMNARQRTACVRALGLLPIDAAREALADYSNDAAITVLAELCHWLNPLSLTRVLSVVAESGVLPDWVGRQFVSDLDALKVLDGLQALSLDGCTGVSDLDVLKGLGSLQWLSLDGCTGVSDLDALKGLGSLQTLSLNGCTGVSDLDALKGLGSLQKLTLNGCTGVSDLDALKGLGSLQWLSLSGCTGVSDLDALKGLGSLQTLSLNRCTGVSDLDALKGLSSLQTLSLYRCTGVSDLDALKGLGSLRKLTLHGCTGVSDLDALKGLVGLQTLILDGCRGVSDLDAIEGLGSLQWLSLEGCRGVSELDALKGLANLQTLYLNNCTGVSDLDALKGLGSLQWLSLSGCTGVSDLDALKRLGSMQKLWLKGCTGVKDWDRQIADLRKVLPKCMIFW